MNINQFVKVKLTQKGLDILSKDRQSFIEKVGGHYIPPEPKIDEDGYTKFQLWELMSTFGEHIYLGCDVPFEPEIVLMDKSF